MASAKVVVISAVCTIVLVRMWGGQSTISGESVSLSYRGCASRSLLQDVDEWRGFTLDHETALAARKRTSDTHGFPNVRSR